MHVKIRFEAQIDLEDSVVFYNSKTPKVGDIFLGYMTEKIAALTNSAGIHKTIHNCHRKILKKFPYAIYYVIHDDIVEVVAVLHQRRGMNFVKSRLGGR